MGSVDKEALVSYMTRMDSSGHRVPSVCGGTGVGIATDAGVTPNSVRREALSRDGRRGAVSMQHDRGAIIDRYTLNRVRGRKHLATLGNQWTGCCWVYDALGF